LVLPANKIALPLVPAHNPARPQKQRTTMPLLRDGRDIDVDSAHLVAGNKS